MKFQEQLSLIMNITIVGEGKQTIVLSHGYGGSQADWQKLLPYLSKNNQVLLFDWNFDSGDHELSKYTSFTSFADELISLVDQMDLIKGNPIVFIGSSMAGMIGCIASIKRPELFCQLIMIGASPRYINSDDYEGGFERKNIDILLSNMELNFQSWADSFIQMILGVDDPLLVEIFAKSFKSMKPETALTLAKTIFYSDMRDILDKVKAPCLIIQTTNDLVVPVSVGHYMQSKMKNSKLCSVETIDINGHLPHLTASEKLIEIMHSVLIPCLEF